MTHPLDLSLLLVAGFIAGIINVLAGGGSMLTVPALIFLGLDPLTANGTNRVGIVVQNLAALRSFQRRGVSDFGTGWQLAAWTLPGALAGAWLASQIDAHAFQQVLSVVLLASVATLFLPMKRAPSAAVAAPHWLVAGPVMLAVGFYGGFIQIGVGFLMMAALQRLLRLDLVRVNVHKLVIVLVYTLPALAIYAWMGEVDWIAGAVLAAGNALGATLGARMAVRGGERWIRPVVAVIVIGMAVKLLVDG